MQDYVTRTEFKACMDDIGGNFRAVFKTLDERFDAIDKRFDAIDLRFNRLEGDVQTLKTNVETIARGINSIMAHFGINDALVMRS